MKTTTTTLTRAALGKVTSMLVRRKALACLHQAWHSWRGLIALLRARTTLSWRTLRRRAAGLAVRSVGAWYSWTKTQKRQRKVVGRIVCFLCKHLARVALLGWAARVDARVKVCLYSQQCVRLCFL